MNNQKGFSPIIVTLVIAAVGLIGLAGYNIYSKNNSDGNSAYKTPVQQQSASQDDIKSVADLDKIDKSLDQIDFSNDENDAKAIESDANSL